MLSPRLTGGSAPLWVSRQHGVVLNMEGEEQLKRAAQLAKSRGGAARIAKGCRRVQYFHFMLDAHEIVFANGAPAESFYPGNQAIGALPHEARREIADLFPDLPWQGVGAAYGAPARAMSTPLSAGRAQGPVELCV